MSITIGNDNSEVKVMKDEITEEVTKPSVSRYAKWFNEMCAGWNKDPEFNLMFLRTQQQYANEILRHRGFLFLNDVYDMLGIPRTKAGQVVGWVYDESYPNRDNYVDFIIYADHNANFVNGYEANCLLDFNVDGNILDHLPGEKEL